MNDLKLIYFEGCPEAKNVRAALLNAGIYDFEVIHQNKLPTEDQFRRYSSPSVLKGNELIYGIRIDGKVSACTFDYINFSDEKKLIDRFKELKRTSGPTQSNLSSSLGFAGSALLALNCPACIPALGALLASLGLSFLISQVVIKFVLGLMLLLSLGGLFFSYRIHRTLLPLLFGAIFSVMMYIGRFHYISNDLNNSLIYVSIAGLLITALWDYRMKVKKLCPSCAS